jgi:hypothetical protein
VLKLAEAWQIEGVHCMSDRGTRVEVAREDAPEPVFDATGTTGNSDGSWVSVQLDEEFGGHVVMLPESRVRPL